jgi:hypothetical protein
MARIRAFVRRVWDAYCVAAYQEWEATGGYGYVHGV